MTGTLVQAGRYVVALALLGVVNLCLLVANLLLLHERKR